MTALTTLISALGLTLLLEIPLGTVILKGKKAAVALILINILTNPALNAALMILFRLSGSYTLYYTALVIGEAAVFIGEGLLIRLLCGTTAKKAFILSAVLNSVSLFLGSAILSVF